MSRVIDRDEVQRRAAAGAVLVEVLGAEYFADAHLPGARNLPLDQVDALAPIVLPDRSAAVIVYCSDPLCGSSAMAAERLEQLGYAHVLEYAGGKQDWVEHGLPVERGPGGPSADDRPTRRQ